MSDIIRTNILMTRLIFLPTPNTLFWFDIAPDADQVLLAIQRGEWRPPPPYENSPLEDITASCQDGTVLVTLRRLPTDQTQAASRRLNRRQSEVLRHLADGLTTRQIALRLRISPRTVLAYIAELKEMFNVPTRAALIASAVAYWSNPHKPGTD